jgi:hypothetical protein
LKPKRSINIKSSSRKRPLFKLMLLHKPRLIPNQTPNLKSSKPSKRRKRSNIKQLYRKPRQRSKS